VLSLERRRRLLELAHRYQVPVLEDDPYSELRYDGEALPSLKALDQRGHVIYLSTFSKVLFPGMRLGYLIAPRPMVRQLVLAKQSVDLHSNTLGQWLLDRFLREGHFDAHLRTLRGAYVTRRDAMRQALERGRQSATSWSVPSGGFYFWCRLPDGVEQSMLLTRAAERGVVYLPGWSCFSDEPSQAFARLNFSYATEDQISQGVARFLDAVGEASSQVTPRSQASGTPPVV
jgi:DNA-binding transcriptional MocR family regulator